MLLAYRIPREPSRPRIAVWRRLERLGVARLGDGLVTLPADARTREQLEWVAEEVTDNDGTATVWLAEPASESQEREIATAMRSARTAEYRAVTEQARTALSDDVAEQARAARRLRSELRRITQRDYFPPPDRDTARLAVQELADRVARSAVQA